MRGPDVDNDVGYIICNDLWAGTGRTSLTGSILGIESSPWSLGH